MKENAPHADLAGNGRSEPGSQDGDLIALRAQLQSVERELWENKVRRADLTARLHERDRWIREVRNSPVWKLVRPFLKLQRHFSRRQRTAASGQSQLVFAFAPTQNSAGSTGATRIEGWCFAHGGPEIVGVRAKVGRKSYFARYGLERKERSYPGAAHAGFSLVIPTTQDSRLRLEAISQGGCWQCFFEGELISSDKQIGSAKSNRNVPPHISGRPDKMESEVPAFPDIQTHEVADVLVPLFTAKHASSTAPRFSVVTLLSSAKPRWIAEAGASLAHQTMSEWEWVLIENGSEPDEMRSVLKSLENGAGPFVRLTSLSNAGRSAALNHGLNRAAGEFVCFLGQTDLLHSHALAAFAQKFDQGFDMVYCDENKFDDSDNRSIEPLLKPEWSPEYFRGVFYTGHLLCLRRDLATRTWFDPAFDGIEKFELILRASEAGARIGHVPKILFHSRKSLGSLNGKTENITLEARAVSAHLQRLGLPARAEPGATSRRLRIIPAPRKSFPRISIIIPTKDSGDLLARCLATLYERTTYPAFEVLLIDNGTTEHGAISTMSTYPARRILFPDPFNYSRANNLGAQNAGGDYLLFLNNDTEVISPCWLEHLLYYAEQPDIGAAGALLLHDNGSVQHAGVVLGMGGTANHAMRGFRATSDGYAGSLSCAREVSAVTAACMIMRKSLFWEVGGFNQEFLTIYQDVDLCLRIRQRGLRIVWTPRARLLHHESVSRQQSYDVVDRQRLLDQWQPTIACGDPYYNPNLNLERADYSLCGSN